MSRSITAGNLITSTGVGTLENAPRRIGRYALHSRLASGGMASVHLGRLLGPVGFARTVAIKRLHPQLIKERSFVSMLLDEARLAARIRHPNVVPVVDVVALEGELFLVMEYVHGETLARLLINAKNQAPPPDVITRIVVDLLNGLHAAHVATDEQGQPLNIVHRDVSPQNVLVGVDGIARVTDFGVAKAVNRLQSTNSGQVKGKLAYMAPEYLQGKGLDRRSDIYSASVLLWEGLTRRRLFARKNSTETMKLIVSGEVPPPSRFAPWLSPVLDEVVMQGLSRDPGKRFSSAQALATALEESAALALPPKVGAWVQEHAASELENRARSLAEVENVESDDPTSLAGGAALVDAVMSTQSPSKTTNPGLSSTVLLNDYTPPEEPKSEPDQAPMAAAPRPAAGAPPPPAPAAPPYTRPAAAPPLAVVTAPAAVEGTPTNLVAEPPHGVATAPAAVEGTPTNLVAEPAAAPNFPQPQAAAQNYAQAGAPAPSYAQPEAAGYSQPEALGPISAAASEPRKSRKLILFVALVIGALFLFSSAAAFFFLVLPRLR